MGVADADVDVIVRVRLPAPVAPPAEAVADGWPAGYFEKVAGFMPELERPPQGSSPRGGGSW